MRWARAAADRLLPSTMRTKVAICASRSIAPSLGNCCVWRKDHLQPALLQRRAGPPHGHAMKLSSAVVLITGANRGLGRALVLRSLAAGARRVYAGARDPALLAPMVRAAPDRIVPPLSMSRI